MSDLDAAQQELRSATGAMRQALAAFDDADVAALQAYARNVRAALSQLEDELDVSGAELTAALAESREQLGESLQAARSSWSAINDEMKLQAHLASLDAKDALGRVESRFGELRGKAGVAADAILHELSEGMGELAMTLRAGASKSKPGE